MKIFTSKQALKNHLRAQKKIGNSIGLVPTMGALHEGHMELIRTSKRTCDLTVCSIFINPTQFTDPSDLKNYPRTADADIARLTEAGCDVLFKPEPEEMYGENETWHLNLEPMESVLEGKSRPGHFQGVTQVVSKLFTIIGPSVAFFGQKDFQQFAVISRMTEMLRMPVKLVMCPIVREPDGLAMSSRNMRLSPGERLDALALYKSLMLVNRDFPDKSISALKSEALEFLNSADGVETDYVEIADAATLLPANEDTDDPIALVAARVGSVRLIDNMLLTGKSKDHKA